MDPFTVALLASVAISTIGGVYSAKKQKKEAKDQAADLEKQAREQKSRALANVKNIDAQAQELIGEQTVATAYGGADVSTGSPLLNYANTLSKAESTKSNMLREVNFDTDQMMGSAANIRRYAGYAQKAAYLQTGAKASEGLYDVNKSYNQNRQS